MRKLAEFLELWSWLVLMATLLGRFGSCWAPFFVSLLTSRLQLPRNNKSSTPPTRIWILDSIYRSNETHQAEGRKKRSESSRRTICDAMNRVVSSSRPPQSPLSPTSAVFTERERRTWITSSSWLLAYFFFNLALTIYNKLVLAGNFPFPYTLTAIHALSGTIGSWICLRRGVYTMATLTLRENLHIVLFSGLYTINIIVSNVSL